LYYFQAKRLIENPEKLDISNKKLINAKYVNLKDVAVGSLKMPYNVSGVTKELMEDIVTSNVQLEKIRQNLRDGSTWKSNERAQENFDNEFGTINVNNLIYNGNQPIFNGKLINPKIKLNLNLNPLIKFNLNLNPCIKFNLNLNPWIKFNLNLNPWIKFNPNST